MEETEITYWYPDAWEEEFRRTGLVQCWLDDYPHLFGGTRGTLTLSPDNTLANLSTYALMYLLRRNDGIESLTYFRLCATAKSKDGRRERLHELVRKWMGNDLFTQLHGALHEGGIVRQGFEGEPDLFCWNPQNGQWFFVEAKGKDRLTDTQRRWFAVCRATLPGVLIKVIRARPLPIERILPTRT